MNPPGIIRRFPVDSYQLAAKKKPLTVDRKLFLLTLNHSKSRPFPYGSEKSSLFLDNLFNFHDNQPCTVSDV